jgi:hypothetical protein
MDGCHVPTRSNHQLGVYANTSDENPLDKFVYFYGNLVAEEFLELFLMAVNGYGFGAMKLLRSMYEHTVTLKYLHEHLDELQAFFDFDRVQQYKLTQQIIETFGEDALPPETVATTEREYAEVKDKFMVKSCKSKTCSEQRVGHTWSKLYAFKRDWSACFTSAGQTLLSEVAGNR